MSRRNGKWIRRTTSVEAKRYSTRSEFQRKARSAYGAARRLGILDEVCSHMSHGNRKWTRHTISVEAKKYQTRKEFEVGSRGAYGAARRLGILDKVCSHMQILHSGHNYCVYVIYNKRRMKAYVGITSQKFEVRVAQHKKLMNTCRSREIANSEGTKFRQMTDYSYSPEDCKDLKLEWAGKFHIDGYTILNTKHTVGDVGLSKPKWTRRTISTEAKKYVSKSEFHKENQSAYNTARRMSILDDVCSHMKVQRKKWHQKAIWREARKYTTRSEFQQEARSAYDAARRLGILDDVCSHMQILYNGYNHCVYTIYNKRLKKAYVGITSQKFENRVIQHKRPNNSCRSREIANIKDTEFKQMTDYSYPPEDCKNMESEWIDKFQTDGYTILNVKCDIGQVSASRSKWTVKMVVEEARKYNSRIVFQREGRSAYDAARRLGILDNVCSHMEKLWEPKWYDAIVRKEAKKYSSRSEFKREARSAYGAAQRLGILDEVCSHMERLKKGTGF